MKQFFSNIKTKITGLFRKKPEHTTFGEDNAGDTMVFSGAEMSELSPKSGKNKRRPKSTTPPVLPPDQLTGKNEGVSSVFKKGRKKPMFAVGVILTTFKVAVVALVLFAAAGLGSALGVANSYLETTPDLDIATIEDQNLTSYIYDSEGTMLTSYVGLENRDYATLDEIPLLMQQAVIATEDVRFYYHSGVDFKRLIASFISNVTSDSVSGGSTITQQLIKNKLLSSERSYKRKIQEASLAIQLEEEYTKDQILEAYLNTIPLGGSNYGVKAAAMDYFGKELEDLTLRETACIAGITQYPSLYNPRSAYYVREDTGPLDERIDHVLEKMYEAEYITLEEMNAAKEDTFEVLEVSETKELYPMPHFVEYAVDDVITHFISSRGLEDTTANRSAIENELRTSGYEIYTTVDPDIQNETQNILATYTDYPEIADSNKSVSKEVDAYGNVVNVPQPQAAVTVIDHNTGNIVAIVGSRTTPTAQKTLNRATTLMPVGSSIKPITVYGPALDLGLGLGSTVANIPVPIDGWLNSSGNESYPTVGSNVGPVTIRKSITSSINNAAARVITYDVGLDVAASYIEPLGIESDQINYDGAGLGLGTSGISVMDMAGAYATIANGGVYVEPLSFSKVLDSDGNVILDADVVRETHKVYEPSSAYMLVDALINAVNSGTGTNAKIDGMTVAGKTGTHVDNNVVFFAGMTPYYTVAVRVAHDDYEEMKGTSGNRGAAPIFQLVMSSAVEGLENKDILDGSASDWGVERATVCSVTGLLATDLCHLDEIHPPVTDYYAVGTAPTVECYEHVESDICSVSGTLTGIYCPADVIVPATALMLEPESVYLQLEHEELLEIFPNLLNEDPNAPPSTSGDTDEDSIFDPIEPDPGMDTPCTVHTYEWYYEQSQKTESVAYAQLVIASARNLLATEMRLTPEQNSSISTQILALETLIDSELSESADIRTQAESLRAYLDEVENSLADQPLFG